MVIEVDGAIEGSDTGMGGVFGLNSVSAAGPSPVPKTVMISPGVRVPCAKLAEFTTPKICGAGPKMDNCASLETPPPGAGVVTAMRRVPGFARYVAGTVARIAVSLTGAEVNGPVRPTEVGV